MFVKSYFLLASLLVSQTIGITLPNGFTFDETLYIQPQPRAVLPQTCSQSGYTYSQCSADCSSVVMCDFNFKPYEYSACPAYSPYCVENRTMCSSNFPMSSEKCLNKAYNNFICTSDGVFPDPTDCTKYHSCNGKNHSIHECPASHRFWYDQPYGTISGFSGHGNFDCLFGSPSETCYCTGSFYCDSYANMFTFRSEDNVYYAYCLEVNPTFKKTLIFKCPEGTYHSHMVGSDNQVECVAPTVV